LTSNTDISDGNGNGKSNPQGVDLVIRNRDMGLKSVPLGWNHKPVTDWTPIYENPEYWFDEKRLAECPKFDNIATAFGRTHLKSSDGKNRYLCGLDPDS
jgi:hypothetical protein